MARKRKKKARGGRRRAKRGASSPDTSASPPTTAEAANLASTDAAPAEVIAEPPVKDPVETASQDPVETRSETRAEPQAEAPTPPDNGAEPTERMPASALAVTLPDVSEGAPDVSGELWSPQRRQPEPELPAVEIHPENPDKAPVVSGVIQGFVAPKDPDARASSVLAVEFGSAEPSIQIEATYRRDTRKLLDAKNAAEAQVPEGDPPEPEKPAQTKTPADPGAPAPGPFNGETDKVDVETAHEVTADPDELPAAELDDVSEDESLPVYAVDQAEAPLIEVPGPDEPEPAPTKRATVLDTSAQPHTGATGEAGDQPSSVPPAQDPRVKDAESPISNTRAYATPDREPEASVGPLKPAALVDTAAEQDHEPASSAKPTLPGVPPLILPKKKPSEAAAPAEPAAKQAPAEPPVEQAPAKPPSTAAGVVSGVIGGAIVTSSALADQQEAGEPLTASGSIIIDPELIAAEQAALAQAAAEKAAAEKAAAEEAAAQEAAIAKAAAEHEAAEKAAAEKAAVEQAAAQKAAAEKAAAEKAEQEKAAAERAAEEKAAEKAEQEKAAEEKAAEEKAEQEKAAAQKAAEEKATAERAGEERAAAEKAREEPEAAETTTAQASPPSAPEQPATTPLSKSMAATVRFELRETGDLPPAPTSEPPTSRPVAKARPTPPAPMGDSEAFSDFERAFFEQDLQKVEEVDTFEDLVQDLPEPETPWGLLFGKPKGKPKKRPEPTARTATEDDKPKKVPRPPHKRK